MCSRQRKAETTCVGSSVGHSATIRTTRSAPSSNSPSKNARILFDYAEKERITHFGTSPKFLDTIAKRGLRPIDTHDLGSLRMLLSTGSPLAPEGYDYVYSSIKKDVCLSSVSGGTDIMGAFADASMVLPVYRGEMQCR